MVRIVTVKAPGGQGPGAEAIKVEVARWLDQGLR